MKKLLLVLLIIPLVSFGQNMVTLEEGTRVLENSPNNLNGYLDAFLDISLKLGYNLNEFKNSDISIRYLSVNEELPDYNNYHDKDSFFAIAFALGMGNDNKIEIVVDYEQWLRLNKIEKFSVMFHELCHDIFNTQHDDSSRSNLMHSSKGPQNAEELIDDFKNILVKYASKYKLKTFIRYGDSYNEFIRINPLKGEIQKDYKNNLIAGTTKEGLSWVAFFNKNFQFEKFVIIHGIFSKSENKIQYERIKNAYSKRYGNSETIYYQGDVLGTEWMRDTQKIEFYSTPNEDVFLLRTFLTGETGTKLLL
jgi:hypothetical protein